VENGVVASTPMDQASRMETEETPIGELSMDSAAEYDLDDEEMPKDQPPKEKPKPKSITISGKDPRSLGLPSGVYKPFGGIFKNHYVLASAFEKVIKDNGFGDPNLVNRPHLSFMYSVSDKDSQTRQATTVPRRSQGRE
jgi:hypothetical protein